MRRPASENMEIIRLVEGTDLPMQATLRQLGVPRSTFYGWYQRYLEAGFDGLQDKQPALRAGWNRIPKRIKDQVLELALDRTDLSPRELACRFTEERCYFVSESSVYRILKAADLITSPAADLSHGRFGGLLLSSRGRCLNCTGSTPVTASA